MATRKHEPIEEYDESRWEYLTDEEALAMFDETARRYMNMSGEEFLRRWETGDFEDPDSSDVIHVGIMAPLFVDCGSGLKYESSAISEKLLSADGAHARTMRSPKPEPELDESRIVYLTREEGLALLDEQAWEYLNMSGEEFLQRWETGDFEDPDSYEVFHVGMLIPLAAE